MYCPNCGATLPENSIYCPYCGTKVSDTPQAQPPITPAQPADKVQPIATPGEQPSPALRGTPPPQYQTYQPPPPPTPVAPSMPFTQKVAGVITKPEQTFQRIGLTSDLVGSALILLIEGMFLALAAILFISKIQWVGEIPGVPGFEMSGIMESLIGIIGPMLSLSTIIAIFIGWIFASAIYWILAKILGGSGSFKTTMTVFGYASIPSIFVAAIGVLWSYLAPPVVIDLSLIFEVSALTGLYTLPPTFWIIDLVISQAIGLWGAVLVSLGLQYSHNLSRQRAFGIGVGVWAFLLILNFLPLSLFL